MIRINLFLLLIVVIFSNYLIGQDAPKNIIIIQEDLNSIDVGESSNKEESNSSVIQYKQKSNEVVNSQSENQDNFLVIDDIEKEFNEWYGVLPSEDGGFGWLMWGDTTKDYALSLLRKTNFNSNSNVLKKLTINFLLSRANAPKLERLTANQNVIVKEEDPFIYFKEQIKILSILGDEKSIKKLVNSIPLELKTESFEKDISKLRMKSVDIPNICVKALDKTNSDQNLKKRKTLIACNIALKKFDQALLAIDLLENDSVESLPYTALARNIIEGEGIKEFTNTSFEINDNINLKIMSLVNYELAKKVFLSEGILLDKIIYEMNLFGKDIQIEALERLTENGLYDFKELEKAYISFYNYTQDNKEIDPLNNLEKQNSLIIRVNLYNLINNTISNLERAKYLNILWMKASQIGIEKTIYKLTRNSLLSLAPDPELSWFIYPATKALIISDNLEEAKTWLFYLSEDLYNRASLDINFCKYLIILYLIDQNLDNNKSELPEINFLLKRLASSLDVSRVEFFRILVSLKSLNYKVDDIFWKSFYMEEALNVRSSNNSQLNNQFFNLDIAVKNNNVAETILISINLLNGRHEEGIDYYKLFKSLNSLYKLGLKQYVRDFVLEFNLDALNL
jgi:hypothetical protein